MQVSTFGKALVRATHVATVSTNFAGVAQRKICGVQKNWQSTEEEIMEVSLLDTDAYGKAQARKLWDSSFIDVIGLALSLGEFEMSKKLVALREEAGFTEPIDWETL
jgi:hypothetical protein